MATSDTPNSLPEPEDPTEETEKPVKKRDYHHPNPNPYHNDPGIGTGRVKNADQYARKLNRELQDISRSRISITQKREPTSVVNIAPLPIKKRIKAMHKSWFEKDELELRKEVEPTLVVQRLRISFWAEYDAAITDGRTMDINRILHGVTAITHWTSRVLKNEGFMAFILTPPQDYIISMTETLDAGMTNLRKIMTANVFDKDGELNTRAADVVLKAFMMVDTRVKGAVVQTVKNENLNFNLSQKNLKVTHTTKDEGPPLIEEVVEEGPKEIPESMSDLEDEIELLKAQIKEGKKKKVEVIEEAEIVEKEEVSE